MIFHVEQIGNSLFVRSGEGENVKGKLVLHTETTGLGNRAVAAAKAQLTTGLQYWLMGLEQKKSVLMLWGGICAWLNDKIKAKELFVKANGTLGGVEQRVRDFCISRMYAQLCSDGEYFVCNLGLFTMPGFNKPRLSFCKVIIKGYNLCYDVLP